MKRTFRHSVYIAAAVATFCGTAGLAAEGIERTLPVGLPAMSFPTNNPGSPLAIELGRRLFFDPHLSGSEQISCASCHIPEKAFTDGKAVAQGIDGREGTRNTPTILNAGYNAAQFWDGRRVTLEEQVLDPFFNPKEHGVPDEADLLRRIRRDAAYLPMFTQAFGVESTEIKSTHVSRALAAYVRSLIVGNSPVDRYLYAGDKAALSADELRGLELFRGPAKCTTCHAIGERTALLTDNDYHSMAIGFDRLAPRLTSITRQAAKATPEELGRLILGDADAAAAGRFIVTLDPQDIGKFKTPSLRNVALTAPYMHDGSIATLEETVNHEIYYRGQAMGRPLILTPNEKADLVAFLKALTSVTLPR